MEALNQSAQLIQSEQEVLALATLSQEELDFIGGGHATVNTI